MITTIKGAVERLKKYFNHGHLQSQDDFPGREDFLTQEELPDNEDSLNQVDFVDMDDIQQIGYLTGRSIKFLEHYYKVEPEFLDALSTIDADQASRLNQTLAHIDYKKAIPHAENMIAEAEKFFLIKTLPIGLDFYLYINEMILN